MAQDPDEPFDVLLADLREKRDMEAYVADLSRNLPEAGGSGAPTRPPQTARELFVRCAKTLLVSGTSGATEMDVPLGLALELVAERNPYLATAGDRLPFRLTYEGKPRANALVIAINERQPAKRLSARKASRM